MVREPILKPVPIDELHPTQITVGMEEVRAKRKEWRAKGDDRAGAFLGRHMIPVVLGPKARSYVLDHHHLARALLDEGVPHVLTTLVSDLSRLGDPENRRGADRRSLSLARRGAQARRRLRQGHDPVQRVPMGRFSAPADREEERREKFCQGGRGGAAPGARP
jgi:hypothetical protein